MGRGDSLLVACLIIFAIFIIISTVSLVTNFSELIDDFSLESFLDSGKDTIFSSIKSLLYDITIAIMLIFMLVMSFTVASNTRRTAEEKKARAKIDAGDKEKDSWADPLSRFPDDN
jgi:TRAP-type C4-dicarboxylate transport system permease small subunit